MDQSSLANAALAAAGGDFVTFARSTCEFVKQILETDGVRREVLGNIEGELQQMVESIEQHVNASQSGFADSLPSSSSGLQTGIQGLFEGLGQPEGVGQNGALPLDINALSAGMAQWARSLLNPSIFVNNGSAEGNSASESNAIEGPERDSLRLQLERVKQSTEIPQSRQKRVKNVKMELPEDDGQILTSKRKRRLAAPLASATQQTDQSQSLRPPAERAKEVKKEVEEGEPAPSPDATAVENEVDDSAKKSHKRRGRPPKEPLKCDQCGMKFAYPSVLRTHLRIHTGERPHVCDVCGKGFQKSDGLVTHMRTHTGERPFQCPDCGEMFSVKGNMLSHVRKTHRAERPFVCAECGDSFANRTMLQRHASTRGCGTAFPFICPDCGKGFRKQRLLDIHARIHTNPLLCPECGKAFGDEAGLERHILWHAGARPYVCGRCGRGFSSNQSMQRHLDKAHGGAAGEEPAPS